MDVPFLVSTVARLSAAIPTTLVLFALSVTLGSAVALAVTWMRLSGVPVLDRLARLYVHVFRGSPLLVQLFLIYYGSGQFPALRHSLLWVVLRDPFACAVLALALCTAAYQTEIFRGGFRAIPRGEVEAARSIGLSGWGLFRRILAPIALRQALPAYTTELVLMVKATSLASLVTVWEVTGVAQKIITQTYRTLEVFLCAALVYLALNYVLLRFFAALEWSVSPHLRRAPRPPAAAAVGLPALRRRASP